MRGLDLLRSLDTPTDEGDPTLELLRVAKSLRAPAETVEKQHTPDTVQVKLDALQVEPANQRPPDRDKIAGMVETLRKGGSLPPIECNCRPDGSLWITDGQHRAAARAIRGEDEAAAIVTYRSSQEEPAMTNIMAKVHEDDDRDAIGLLLGAGGRLDGKRVVLELGAAGRVSYLPRGQEYVAKTERGCLRVTGGDAAAVAKALCLDELSLEGGGFQTIEAE